MLRGVDWWEFTDVSEEPISPIFTALKTGLVGFPEKSADTHQCTLRNVPEERRSYLKLFASFFCR
jgi:hypothetical protein